MPVDLLPHKTTMIIGLGIDLIETTRIQSSLERFGDRFLNRIFLPDEIKYCMGMASPSRHLAARFAAKEAVSKAFGTGIGHSIGWLDIEITRHESGQPHLQLHGKGAELARQRGVNNHQISLTHHETAAAAVAILIGKQP